jgi:magnesium chelatase family protein
VRPFRAPHHTSSTAALTGGGSDPRPGEISLAHHGVLFLDELPEWDRRVLDALREPLESGVIHISRAARQSTFPAQFQFVAAMNPCPCGWLGHESGRCHCTPDRIARYRGRVSGPLLDRIDLGIEVPAVTPEELAARGNAAQRPAFPSVAHADARAQATGARARQIERQGTTNARLGPREIETHCTPDAAGAALLAQAMARLSLSARAYHRILKVARSIADLVDAPTIGAAHVAEAVGYRRFDRM